MKTNRVLNCFILLATIGLHTTNIGEKAVADGGGVLIQAVDNKITTNLDDEAGNQTYDVPAYSVLFNPTATGGNNGPVDTPSFLSLASPPGGTAPLPQGANLYWDFLPMTIDGTISNLFHWDGIGNTPADVEFGAVPQANVTLSIFDPSFNEVGVDGSAEMIPGALVDTTDSGGSALRLHAHRFFFLDDNDANDLTQPPDGIYLFALQLRMDGMINSDPFFMVAGTFGVSLTALESAALPWATDNADLLILEGDYNFDGHVGGLDFLAWQEQFGIQQQYPTGPFPVNDAYADGDGSGIVDAGDLTVWKMNFGPPPTSVAAFAKSVPEPGTLTLAVSTLGIVLTLRKRKPACSFLTH